MIFPGHLAATVLCHRHLKVAFWPAFWAGLLPDVIDKTLYYVLHLVPGSRVPMHTLWGWLGSTLLLGLAASILAETARQDPGGELVRGLWRAPAVRFAR